MAWQKKSDLVMRKCYDPNTGHVINVITTYVCLVFNMYRFLRFTSPIEFSASG